MSDNGATVRGAEPRAVAGAAVRYEKMHGTASPYGAIGKFLLDQGEARNVAGLLRDTEPDAMHVGECGLTTADDAAIMACAREEDRTVVTLDADFSTLLTLSAATRPSVIHIRIEGCDSLRPAPYIVRRKSLPVR